VLVGRWCSMGGGAQVCGMCCVSLLVASWRLTVLLPYTLLQAVWWFLYVRDE